MYTTVSYMPGHLRLSLFKLTSGFILLCARPLDRFGVPFPDQRVYIVMKLRKSPILRRVCEALSIEQLLQQLHIRLLCRVFRAGFLVMRRKIERGNITLYDA